LANAQECQVDKQGRILLPPHLREYAGLDKNVMFAAALKKFRIWDKTTWDRFNSESEQQFSQNPNMFNGLNA
jgi:MraZ protein